MRRYLNQSLRFLQHSLLVLVRDTNLKEYSVLSACRVVGGLRRPHGTAKDGDQHETYSR